MPKVQLSDKGRYSITIPRYIAEAMGLKKADYLIFQFTGRAWKLRKKPE